MNKKIKVELSVFWHGVSRVLKWIPILVVSFLLLAFALFQIPKIQTRLLNELSAFIAQNTSFRLTIGYANLTWYDEILLDDVRLFQAVNDSTLFQVEHMSIDFGILHYLFYQEIKGDELHLHAPYVNLIKPNDSTETNINLFINELKTEFAKSKSKKKTNIYIDQIEIVDGLFSYHSIGADSISSDHLIFNGLNSQIEDFVLEPDSIAMRIKAFAAYNPHSPLDIESLKGDFHFTPNKMGLTQMKLQTNHSIISDSIVLHFSSPDQLKYMLDSVQFDVNLSETKIDSRDLALFDQRLDMIKDTLLLSGKFLGSIAQLNINKLDAMYGSTHLKGSGYFYGLPNIAETFVDFHFTNTSIHPSDFRGTLSQDIMGKFEKIGPINLNGDFSGFLSNFVANGSLESDVGFADSDINFRIDEENVAHYQGKLLLKNFKANEVFEEISDIQNISLSGEIHGKGMEINNADFHLNAKIDSVNFSKFGLKDITTQGHFAKQFLNAEFDIKDPKLRFNGAVEIDVRTDQNKFSANARIDTLDLYAMGLTPEPLLISTVVDANMKGLKIDEMRGYLYLTQSKFHFKNQVLRLDTVQLVSSLINEQREILLTSDDLSAQLKGKFNNSELFKSLSNVYQEVMVNLENDSTKIQNYYREKASLAIEKLHAELKINLRNLNPYIQPFYPGFHASKDIQMTGYFSQDSTTTLSFYAHLDTIRMDDHQILEAVLDLNISKDFYDKDILGSLTMESDYQEWYSDYKTENLSSEIIWDKDHMTFWTTIKQPEQSNNMNLSGEVNFKKDYTSIHMLPARLSLLDQRWKWNEHNEIRINQSDVTFADFGLFNANQKIEANGVYGLERDQAVNISLVEMDLKSIQSIVPFNLEGKVNGAIKVKKGAEKQKTDGKVIIRAIKIQDFPMGDLFVNSEWNNEESSMDLEINLMRNGNNKMKIGGTLYPQGSENQLDLNAQFFDSDLELLNPIIESSFSSIKGSLSGKTSITGKISEPELNGQLSIENGQAKVNYLNTTYAFNGSLQIKNNRFSTKSLSLTDPEGNAGLLFGEVSYTKAGTVRLDLDGRFQNFKVLNTNSVDNNLYYGSAYATGTVKFRGTNKDLLISANAKSEKGTKLFFPISQNKNFKTDQKDYIQFINLTAVEKQSTEPNNTEDTSEKIKGIRLDLDLEMTQDAYIELIFDIKSGDIIRGRGDGNLNLIINTEGDFSMLGDYSINQGGYNFTLYNIINKEFSIKKGSTIAWYGDPYGAILSIEAQYKQLASLLPILTDVSEAQQNSIEFRKKYYTTVQLKLTENLLTPNIKFDISIDDYPKSIVTTNTSGAAEPPYPLESHVNAFKTKIRNNEQEMNRQVFSLLILRKFSPENSFQVNSSTIGSSLSEFVSNQLSYWATQVDENLEIDVDLASLDDDAFSTFQLRLSYTFMSGRLKVTRGGGIPTNQTNENVYSFIGDWSVEYLLTKDGRFRAKLYSRADLDNTINNQQANGNSVETGFSLVYVRSFDEIKEILRDSRNKGIANSTDEAREQ